MSEWWERDVELIRSILTNAALEAMEEQSKDFQVGVAYGDQVDLALEALDRIATALVAHPEGINREGETEA